MSAKCHKRTFSVRKVDAPFNQSEFDEAAFAGSFDAHGTLGAFKRD
jgi:hypothetical protein